MPHHFPGSWCPSLADAASPPTHSARRCIASSNGKTIHHIAFSTRREFCKRRCKVCTEQRARAGDRRMREKPYFAGLLTLADARGGCSEGRLFLAPYPMPPKLRHCGSSCICCMRLLAPNRALPSARVGDKASRQRFGGSASVLGYFPYLAENSRFPISTAASNSAAYALRFATRDGFQRSDRASRGAAHLRVAGLAAPPIRPRRLNQNTPRSPNGAVLRRLR